VPDVRPCVALVMSFLSDFCLRQAVGARAA
jgi:hypothetical protein